MVTSCPAFAQSAAHVIDAGPEPMIATFLPVRGTEVGAEALDASDRHGLVYVLEHLAHRAELLALLLLGTDPAADRGEE